MKRFNQFINESAWSVAFEPAFERADGFSEPIVDASYSKTAEPDDYYYHITLRQNAESILRSGELKAGYKKLAGKNLPDNARNRVFLTDRNGVQSWVEKIHGAALDSGQYNTRNPHITVLRIPKSALKGVVVAPDDVGTRDAHAPAYYVTGGFRA
jgi:hypothetical protein